MVYIIPLIINSLGGGDTHTWNWTWITDHHTVMSFCLMADRVHSFQVLDRQIHTHHTHTHTHMHTHTHTYTHARTHTHIHTHTNTHTHTHIHMRAHTHKHTHTRTQAQTPTSWTKAILRYWLHAGL